MNEREEAVRHDILMFRQLADIEATVFDKVMTMTEVNLALISEKNQAVILYQLYDGLVELATRLGERWGEALQLTREAMAEGTRDEDAQVAFDRLLRQTRHLIG